MYLVTRERRGLGADSTLTTKTGAPSGFDWSSLFPALFGMIPGLLQSIPAIVGLFKKTKPTLTTMQMEALRRLPEPYLSRAVAELEGSTDMQSSFARIYEKYGEMWAADQRVKQAAKQKAIVTVAIIGAFAITAGIVGYTLTRR